MMGTGPKGLLNIVPQVPVGAGAPREGDPQRHQVTSLLYVLLSRAPVRTWMALPEDLSPTPLLCGSHQALTILSRDSSSEVIPGHWVKWERL